MRRRKHVTKCPTCVRKKQIAQKANNKSEEDMPGEKKVCRCTIVRRQDELLRINSSEKDVEAPVSNIASDERLARLAELRLALKR